MKIVSKTTARGGGKSRKSHLVAPGRTQTRILESSENAKEHWRAPQCRKEHLKKAEKRHKRRQNPTQNSNKCPRVT